MILDVIYSMVWYKYYITWYGIMLLKLIKTHSAWCENKVSSWNRKKIVLKTFILEQKKVKLELKENTEFNKN